MGQFLGPAPYPRGGLSDKGFFGALPVPVPPPSGTWILRPAFPLAHVQAIAGTSTRMVVLDGGGNIAYSDDHGATWAMGSGFTSTDDGLTLTVTHTGFWLAVCSNGAVLSSPDGATWTPISTLPQIFGNPNIVWGNGLFVVGVQSSSQVVDVYTSPDGITWTGQPTTTPNQLTPFLYDGTDFVAAAKDAGGTNNVVAASPTGNAWSTTLVPQFNPRSIVSMAFHNGIYVATNGDFPSVIQQSPSSAWVGTDVVQPLDDNVAGVSFANGLWCLVGDRVSGTFPEAATSTDLTTWALEDLQFGPGNYESVKGVTYAGGTLVSWTTNGNLSTRG